MQYKRLLDLNTDLPKGQSTFLWGPRKTGKTTYLKKRFPDSVYIDFLNTEKFLKYNKEPHLLREEILSFSNDQLQSPIILDEIQKIPTLLDEIHWLIENTEAYFILCGSSAKKLRQAGVNLLGGRAWKTTFFPLTYPEITDFNLQKLFNHGALPSHYQSEHIEKALQAYVDLYLVEEIKNEGLVRDLASFARFLDSVGFCNAEKVNFNNIAQDCGVNAKLVKDYFQILIDTFLGFYLEPFTKTKKRNVISATNKFYLFDIGVANYLAKQSFKALQGPAAGKCLEQLIFLELTAYKSYHNLRFNINYWQTKTGLEVDFVLDDGRVAVEVKLSNQVRLKDLKGLKSFSEDFPCETLIVVSQDPKPRTIKFEDKTILVLPVEEFLNRLWAKELI